MSSVNRTSVLNRSDLLSLDIQIEVGAFNSPFSTGVTSWGVKTKTCRQWGWSALTGGYNCSMCKWEKVLYKGNYSGLLNFASHFEAPIFTRVALKRIAQATMFRRFDLSLKQKFTNVLYACCQLSRPEVRLEKNNNVPCFLTEGINFSPPEVKECFVRLCTVRVLVTNDVTFTWLRNWIVTWMWQFTFKPWLGNHFLFKSLSFLFLRDLTYDGKYAVALIVFHLETVL